MARARSNVSYGAKNPLVSNLRRAPFREPPRSSERYQLVFSSPEASTFVLASSPSNRPHQNIKPALLPLYNTSPSPSSPIKEVAPNRDIPIITSHPFANSDAMAAMIAARRAPVPKLLEKLLFSPARPTAAAASRLFNTNAQFRDLDDDRSLEVDRRRDDSSATPRGRGGGDAFFPSVFSDVLDPFNTTRSLSQVLNMMDQMLDIPFAAASRGIGGFRRGWDARESSDALYLRVDMPGLGKENVKVRAEQNTLIIEGEVEKETGEEESGRRYSSRIDLPPEAYKLDQIRAEMKNGILKVVVPKVREEERKDVFEVKIE